MAASPDQNSRPRVFYGWILAFSLLVIYFLADGVSLTVPPILYPRLIAEFGATEGAVSFCGAITLIVAGMVAPFAGILLDRFGPRTMIRLGILLLGLCGIFYVRSTSLWQLYLLHLFLGIGLVFCGMLSIVVLVSDWFVQRRATVLGLVLAGSSLSGAILPNLLAPVVTDPQYGWRWGYGLVLVLLLAFGLPLSLFAIKERPSELNVYPDVNPRLKEAGGEDRHFFPSKGAAFHEATRQSAFWVFALSLATLWFSLFVFHSQLVIFIKQDLGLTQALASFCFSLIFISSVTGNLAFSALSDRLGRHRIIVFTAFMLFFGSLLLLDFSLRGHGVSPELTKNVKRLLAFSVLFGLGYGGTFTILQAMVSDRFGTGELGRILGTLTFIGTVGGFAGIASSGFLRTWTGSYLIPFLIVSFLCGFMAVLLFLLKRLTGNTHKTNKDEFERPKHP